MKRILYGLGAAALCCLYAFAMFGQEAWQSGNWSRADGGPVVSVTIAPVDLAASPSAGLVLTATSATTMAWQAISGAALTVIDAKGDIIVGTAADTAARLAVGANDTIPMADSAEATGLKYVAGATTSELADVASAEAAGTSDTYARGDHAHQLSVLSAASTASRYGIIEDELFSSAATTHIYDGGIVLSATAFGAGESCGAAATETNMPFGMVTCTTGTNAAGRAALASTSAFQGVDLGQGIVTFTARARLNQLSDGTDTFTVRMGLSDSSATDGTDSVLFKYTDADGGADATWQGVATSNSVQSTCDTTVVASTATVPITFQFVVNAAASSVEFFTNGVSRCTISTNIPSGASRVTGLVPMTILKSAGTTARTMSMDYYRYSYEFTTAR